MAKQEIITFNVSENRLESPQSGSSYLFPADVYMSEGKDFFFQGVSKLNFEDTTWPVINYGAEVGDYWKCTSANGDGAWTKHKEFIRKRTRGLSMNTVTYIDWYGGNGTTDSTAIRTIWNPSYSGELLKLKLGCEASSSDTNEYYLYDAGTLFESGIITLSSPGEGTINFDSVTFGLGASIQLGFRSTTSSANSYWFMELVVAYKDEF